MCEIVVPKSGQCPPFLGNCTPLRHPHQRLEKPPKRWSRPDSGQTSDNRVDPCFWRTFVRCDPRFTLGVTKLQNMGVGSTPPDAHGATATHSWRFFSVRQLWKARLSLNIERLLVYSITESSKKVPRFFVWKTSATCHKVLQSAG